MKDFEIKVPFACPADELYLALTTAFAINIWTAEPCVMEPVEGTEFELWDGDICGKNRAFTPNKYIEQEWYFAEEEVPEEQKSIVRIYLNAKSANKTELRVIHSNIPDEAYSDITEGWRDVYLASLKAFIEEDE